MFVISSGRDRDQRSRRPTSVASAGASQGVRTMRVEEGATVVALAPVIAAVELE